MLQNYTTYKTYCKLAQAATDDPNVPKREAVRALARFVTLHPHNIAQKTEVMVEHFREHVTPQDRRQGQGDGGHRLAPRTPSATSRRSTSTSRRRATRTSACWWRSPAGRGRRHARRDVHRARHEHGIREKELPEKFATDEYHVLLVADKYQTGFDQPLLHTMYVDKRLAGIQAVQTLSRLNRTRPRQGGHVRPRLRERRRGDPASFQPYYEQTTVAETADPQHLYELQHHLDAAQVYTPSEVEAFCKVFYAPKAEADDGRQRRAVPAPRPGGRPLQGARPGRRRTSSGARSAPTSGCTPSCPGHAVHRPRPGEALHVRPLPG